MLKLGVIEESQSSWSSPITLVRKKSTGKVRLCLDARKLNEVTVKDAYPLPWINGLLSRLDQTKYISSIDLKDAFWQIPLEINSRDKTAFTVPGRPLYQFTVMPFGLCNAPQSLCRLMHRVIPHQLQDRVFVYLDDLLVVSATLEEHFTLLFQVAQHLRRANLTINVDKSQFVMTETKYLGHVIGNGTIRMDPDKIEAISNYPQPTTVKQLRRFLGLSGWYQRFIANYAGIAAPLTDLFKKNQKMIWSDQAVDAFNHLKTALTTAPVLRNPNFSKKFYIQCDASNYGIGSVLFQKTDDNEEYPIAFFSHKLNPAQKKYSVTELECLAAVMSVKKFRPYVEGYVFTIITDHSSLKWLMDQRDLSGRLARWSLKLQGFNFNIEYRKGSLNVVPDSLSRSNIDSLSSCLNPNNDLQIPPLHIDLDSTAFSEPDYLKKISVFQQSDNSKTNFKVNNGKLFILPSNSNDCDNIEFSHWKLVVPSSLTKSLIVQAHNPPSSSHMGYEKTLELLRRQFHWTTMSRDVRQYVINCERCKTIKPTNYVTRPLMGEYHEINTAFQKLYIDFLGPYPRSKSGNCYLLIVLDKYTKFVLLEPLRTASAQHVVNFLSKRVFNVFGVPEFLFSDNGPQFRSQMLHDFLNKFGVTHQFTPYYSPQANASERVNRTVISAIRAYVHENHRDWDLHLNEIGLSLRNFVHSATGFSPFFLVFGHHMVTHGSSYRLLRELGSLNDNYVAINNSSDRLFNIQQIVSRHLKDAHSRNASRYNLRSRIREFIPGQQVFVRNFVKSNAGENFASKLALKFVKAVVTKKIGNVAYELHTPDQKFMGVYHAKDIR